MVVKVSTSANSSMFAGCRRSQGSHRLFPFLRGVGGAICSILFEMERGEKIVIHSAVTAQGIKRCFATHWLHAHLQYWQHSTAGGFMKFHIKYLKEADLLPDHKSCHHTHGKIICHSLPVTYSLTPLVFAWHVICYPGHGGMMRVHQELPLKSKVKPCQVMQSCRSWGLRQSICVPRLHPTSYPGYKNTSDFVNLYTFSKHSLNSSSSPATWIISFPLKSQDFFFLVLPLFLPLIINVQWMLFVFLHISGSLCALSLG